MLRRGPQAWLTPRWSLPRGVGAARDPRIFTEPRRPGVAPPSSSSSTGAVLLPGEAARREATNVRLAEESFYREAKRAAVLSLPAIAERTRRAEIEKARFRLTGGLPDVGRDSIASRTRTIEVVVALAQTKGNELLVLSECHARKRHESRACLRR